MRRREILQNAMDRDPATVASPAVDTESSDGRIANRLTPFGGSEQEPSWYSPLFSAVGSGEVRDISLRDADGEDISTKHFIDVDNRVVSVQVPSGVDQSTLTPELDVTEGFEVEPAPEEARDFSDPVSYTLRNPDSGESSEWEVTVFDADSGRILSGEAFTAWSRRTTGYDDVDVLDNSDGLYFELAGEWALFFHDNTKPVTEIKWKHEQNDHPSRWGAVLQVLDLASVPADDLSDPEWPAGANDENLVRSTYGLSEVGGEITGRVDFSSDPIGGPIAFRYGRGERQQQAFVHITKVLLQFD